MAELSPKDMDKLFQEGSKQYDFEYNEAAWQQMEVLLERRDRRRRFIWWFLGGFGSLLLFGGICFWWNSDLQNSELKSNNPAVILKEEAPSKINTNEKNPNTINTVVKPLEEVKLTTPSNGDSIIPDNATQSSISIKDKFVLNKHQNEVPSNINSQEKIKRQQANSGFDAIPEEVSSTGLNLAGMKVLSVEENPTNTNPAPSIKSKEPLSARSLTKAHQSLEYLPTLPLFIQRTNEPFIYDFRPLLEKLNKPLPSLDFTNRNHILLGFSLGGELNSVGTKDFSKAGWAFGLNAEYRYSQKYSLGLGINFIKKNYRVGEGAYTPPKGFWTRKIAPQSTEGHCTVLEIPVLVNFFPKGYLTKGFYVNAGFTSYFMLRERYNYFYDLPDTDLIRAWGTENENRHWFGIGRFSLGYQYFVKPKVVFQVAPYVQFPLTGIGHGNVKLWNIGLTATVNFQVK